MTVDRRPEKPRYRPLESAEFYQCLCAEGFPERCPCNIAERRVYRIDVCVTCGERVLASGYGCDQHPSADTKVIEVVPRDENCGT